MQCMQPLVQQLHGLSFEAVIQEIHQNGLASTCRYDVLHTAVIFAFAYGIKNNVVCCSGHAVT